MKAINLIVDQETCSLTEVVGGNAVASIRRDDGNYAQALVDVAGQVTALITSMACYPAFRISLVALEQSDIDAYNSKSDGTAVPTPSIFD